MDRINQYKQELKDAVNEYLNTDSANITPCALFVITGFIDYTFALEDELRRQEDEIRRLQEMKSA